MERIQLETELEKERLEKEKALLVAAEAEYTREIVRSLGMIATEVGKVVIESLQSERQLEFQEQQFRHEIANRNDDYGPFGYFGFITYKAYSWIFGIKKNQNPTAPTS